jgi:hypothetical protein
MKQEGRRPEARRVFGWLSFAISLLCMSAIGLAAPRLPASVAARIADALGLPANIPKPSTPAQDILLRLDEISRREASKKSEQLWPGASQSQRDQLLRLAIAERLGLRNEVDQLHGSLLKTADYAAFIETIDVPQIATPSEAGRQLRENLWMIQQFGSLPDACHEGGNSAQEGFIQSLNRTLGDPETEASLIRNGPRVLPFRSPNCIPILGFVKGGWPVVLDYESAGGNAVVLGIYALGLDSPFIYKAEPKQIRRVVRFELPALFGEKLRPALLVLRVTNPVREKDGVGPVFGLGAGPRAVGSIAIDRVEFGPPNVNVSNKETAVYSFYSRSDFNRAAVEINRIENEAGVVRVRLAKEIPIARAVNRGDWIGHPEPLRWNGDGESGKTSEGVHLLEVRAWVSASHDRDWVWSTSSSSVMVHK